MEFTIETMRKTKFTSRHSLMYEELSDLLKYPVTRFMSDIVQAFVLHGNVDDIKLLISRGGNTVSIMRDVCALHQNVMFDYLTSIGVVPDSVCLSNAIFSRRGNYMIDRILQFNVVPDRSTFNSVCRSGNLPLLNKFIIHGCSVNGIDKYTPLREAVRLNQTDVALFLLSMGASVSDVNGKTPLKYAIKHNNKTLIEALKQHGA